MDVPWFTGLPREEINWHPTIDSERCVQCGMCMNCGKSVFEWTENGPRVARPNACVVGCSTCANLCRAQCISFPDPKELRKVYARHGIWDKVKQQLIEEGVIPGS